jgi:hypothetical protein
MCSIRKPLRFQTVELYIGNATYVKCDNTNDTSNNRGNWNHLTVNHTSPEQYARTARNQGTTANSHTGHCAHTSESRNVKYETFDRSGFKVSHCSCFRIMCDVLSIAVFCSASIECLTGIESRVFFS